MAVLLLLGYAAVCVAIFKLARIPLNRWSVTTATIGGIAIVGAVLLGMNYSHPFTANARLYFYTTPIIPTVQGQVVEVAIEPNVPVAKGDLLFAIDPRPYQYVVDQQRAALAEAEQGVGQLGASAEQASAAVERARADVTLTGQEYDRQAELLSRDVVSQAAVDTAARNRDAAAQALAEAEAAAERAELASSSEIGGVNTGVAALAASLRNAEFDLSQTRVTAPSDGYVTQLFLRTGMTIGPGTQTMVFIDTAEPVFGAAFPQQVLSRLAVGAEGEVAFDAVPGEVFSTQILAVQEAIASGQLQAAGTLVDPDAASSGNSAFVRLAVPEGLDERQLPPGSHAQVAIYSEHLRPLAAIRRILIRMKSWLNYIVL